MLHQSESTRYGPSNFPQMRTSKGGFDEPGPDALFFFFFDQMLSLFTLTFTVTAFFLTHHVPVSKKKETRQRGHRFLRQPTICSPPVLKPVTVARPPVLGLLAPWCNTTSWSSKSVLFEDHGICSGVITDSHVLERAVYEQRALAQPLPSASQLDNREKGGGGEGGSPSASRSRRHQCLPSLHQ